MVVDKPAKFPDEYEPNANDKARRFIAGEFRFVSNKEERLKVSKTFFYNVNAHILPGAVSARRSENPGICAKHKDSGKQVRRGHDEPSSEKTLTRASW